MSPRPSAGGGERHPPPPPAAHAKARGGTAAGGLWLSHPPGSWGDAQQSWGGLSRSPAQMSSDLCIPGGGAEWCAGGQQVLRIGPPTAWPGSGPCSCLRAAAAPSPACEEAPGGHRGKSCPRSCSAGLSPHPELYLGREAGEVCFLSCLLVTGHSSGHGGHVLTCPLPVLTVRSSLPVLGGDTPLCAGAGLVAGLSCLSLPAGCGGFTAGEGRREKIPPQPATIS